MSASPALPADLLPHAPARGLRMLGAHDVGAWLQGRERDAIDLVQQVLAATANGQAQTLPPATLRSAAEPRGRFTAHAAWCQSPVPLAGLLWSASFAHNADNSGPRSSALVVLNDPHSGQPVAVLEGSLIISLRTAALAALAARALHQQPRIGTLGVMGCGLIGRETLRCLLADGRPVDTVLLHDNNRAYSRSLAQALRDGEGFRGAVSVARSRRDVLERSDVLVFATAAVKPSLDSLERAPRHSTLLHLSLRDLTANAVLQADNITDDIDLLLHAQTSAQRTFQLSRSRTFLRATLGQVLNGQAEPRDGDKPVVFHPCGQTAVDLALAHWVADGCARDQRGTVVPDFWV